MLVDVNFKFEGNWGSVGKCHLRFCQLDESKPLVIVCSQYKNYNGTSITNAVERIAESVFYQIANRNIEGLRFTFDLPIFEKWDEDVNLFDRLLVKVFPKKYTQRFKSNKLNIKEIFDRIIWIEHYPAGWSGADSGGSYQLVRFDDSKRPEWHGQPSERWLIEETGYTTQELLLPSSSLDLGKNSATMYEPVEILRHLPGLQVIRWTEELVAGLPAMLSSTRIYKNLSEFDDVKEGTIQDQISEFLSLKLPAGFFQAEYDFSKLIGIPYLTKQKSADFAIFLPDRKSIDSILEVKRTSTKTTTLKNEVCKDIARLILLSSRLKCTCYLLVCGSTQLIQSQLQGSDEYLSFINHPSDCDKHFPVSAIKLDAEYKKLLDTFYITEASSRLQGAKSDGKNSVFLWQVSANMYELEFNKPYRCNIQAA